MSESKPTQLSDALLSGGAIAAETAGPTQQPPAALGGAVGIGAGVGASVWVSGKQVNALWAINENRNSWIGVTGVGWVKLANNSDSAIVALTMLGANAKLTQGTVNYRQEADNMIYEMYVW